MARSSNASLKSWGWPVLCLVLAVTLLFLVYENNRLKRQLLDPSSRPQVSQDGAQAGDQALPVEGYLPSGELVTLVGDSLTEPLILAWFSDDCEACYFAKEGWNYLAREIPGQIWAIRKNFDGQPDSLFFGEKVGFPILTPVDSRVFDDYHVYGTPQTVLINRDRTVGRVWKGALSPDKTSEILALAKTRN